MDTNRSLSVCFSDRLQPRVEQGVSQLGEGGHVFPFSRMIKDSLDWLDRYLGVPR